MAPLGRLGLVKPLARVTIAGDTPPDLERLLSLLRIEPLAQNLAQRSDDRTALFVGFGHVLPPQYPRVPVLRLAVGNAGYGRDADFVSDSTLPAACFVLSHALGLGSPFLTADLQMFAVIRAAVAIAPGAARVVVEGETGAGKESLVRLIHSASGIAAPIARLDCAAFDAALAAREIAPGEARTIFLDHLAELAPADQAKLLGLVRAHDRALAAGRASATIRLIAGANRPLARMVADGRFLPELHHLFDVTLEIPPLRARPDDIRMLASHFLWSLNRRHAFSAGALRALCHYRFSGNVRELHNLVIRFAIASTAHGARILRRADVMNQLATADSIGLAAPASAVAAREAAPEVLAAFTGDHDAAAPGFDLDAHALIRLTTTAIPNSRKRSRGNHFLRARSTNEHE